MDVQEKLDNLRTRYAADLSEQVSSIHEYWQLLINDPGDQESIRGLLDICHGLAGTGASFGFPLLSEHSREIEHFLRPISEKNKNIDIDKMYEVTELIELLDDDCRQVVHN
jgi:hypothetical protein